MLGKVFDRILHEDEDAHDKEEKEEKHFNPNPKTVIVLLVFLLAIVPRLIVLFGYSDPENVGPGWYGDAYHHWQIAYLSREIGFKQNFLRLWDFKGLEYYWGLLHPLVLILGFALTGSTSILVPRIVSILFGSLSITLIYLIISRYFNKLSAFASAVFLSFMPVVLFSDTVGMQEPLGLFLLLLGIYLWPRHPGFTGLSWMSAGMVRSEYWIFGGILLFSVILLSKNTHRKVIAMLGYFIPMLFYMKYLLDYTGNPIYPVWIAYLATYKGDWFLNVTLTSVQAMVKLASQIIFFTSLAAAVVVFIKRPKHYLLLILGIANVALVAVMHGFGAYVRGYEHKVLVDRLLAFPYGFVGILLSIFLLDTLPKKVKTVGYVFGILIFTTFLIVSQVSWLPINFFYSDAKGVFEGEKHYAEIISQYYEGKGTILLPPGRAAITYSLVNYEGIAGNNMVSELYDPFYYYQGKDPFGQWQDFREEIIKWLKKENAELFVVTGDFGLSENLSNYVKMMALEEGKLFVNIYDEPGFRIYKVNLPE